MPDAGLDVSGEAKIVVPNRVLSLVKGSRATNNDETNEYTPSEYTRPTVRDRQHMQWLPGSAKCKGLSALGN